jgi:hypothetical protein
MLFKLKTGPISIINTDLIERVDTSRINDPNNPRVQLYYPPNMCIWINNNDCERLCKLAEYEEKIRHPLWIVSYPTEPRLGPQPKSEEQAIERDEQIEEIVKMAEEKLEVKNCTRDPGHDGPCNGWPCETAKQKMEFRYGDNRTVHRTGHVDVEAHKGKVVAVWFRCVALPFRQLETHEDRAKDMTQMYLEREHRTNSKGQVIKAIVFED